MHYNTKHQIIKNKNIFYEEILNLKNFSLQLW